METIATPLREVYYRLDIAFETIDGYSVQSLLIICQYVGTGCLRALIMVQDKDEQEEVQAKKQEKLLKANTDKSCRVAGCLRPST